MTRDQCEALRARLAKISYYEPAVIDGIAEQALDGAKELLARVEALEAGSAALRARSVPTLVWHPTEYFGDFGGERLPGEGFAAEIGGIFRFVVWRDGDNGWRVDVRIAGVWKQICCDGFHDSGLAKDRADREFLKLVGINPLDMGKVQK